MNEDAQATGPDREQRSQRMPGKLRSSIEARINYAANNADLSSRRYSMVSFPKPLRWAARRVYGALRYLLKVITIPQTHYNKAVLETLRLMLQHHSGIALAPNQMLESRESLSLNQFLASNSSLAITREDRPELSIIIVAHNRAELLLTCVYSITKAPPPSYELIVVDNASTDQTDTLLNRFEGIDKLKNDTNLHFLHAANQAAKMAKGEYLLFLNSDAEILGNGINTALAAIRSNSKIGAIGAKVVLPDGSLQEAGSIIWRDGSCSGYGRERAPLENQFMFRRTTDYCSAVFLLTRRDDFLMDGGFDPQFSPAYYEDADYCVRLWQSNRTVVYEPNVVVVHHEGASAANPIEAVELQVANRARFVAKHREWLKSRLPLDRDSVLSARCGPTSHSRFLFIDDRVPHSHLGSGFPRNNLILKTLVGLDYEGTMYPTRFPVEDWAEVYSDIPAGIEIFLNRGAARLGEFLAERRGHYDVIIVSRPHNMAEFQAIVETDPSLIRGTRVIYDAEAFYATREVGRNGLAGNTFSDSDKERMFRREASCADAAHTVIAVSEHDRDLMSRYCRAKNVVVLSHAVDITPTERPFEQRSGFLFVGPVFDARSPNADSLAWLEKDILPMIHNLVSEGPAVTAAGLNMSLSAKHGNTPGNTLINFVGKVDDLFPLYDTHKAFIAPTRFSAGIPLKIIEAAAHGIPVVCTTQLAAQLGWKHEVEALASDTAMGFAEQCARMYHDPELWQTVRENALARVKHDYSIEQFTDRLRHILRSA